MKEKNGSNDTGGGDAARTLLQRIEEAVQTGRHTGTSEYFNKIQGYLKEAESVGDTVSKIYCHALLSEYYYDFFDEKLFRYHLIEASKNSEEIREKNPISVAITYNMMGIDEFNKGNLELSLENYMNVIDISGENDRVRYIAMLNIACIHGKLGNVRRRLEFVKEAYAFFLNNYAGINRAARLNSICQYIECEVALNNVDHIKQLIEEMNAHVEYSGDAVRNIPLIESSRIYYYMMISDDEGIESQLTIFLEKLRTVDNLIDYAQDICDLCYELLKYGKYRYTKEIIDVVFDTLVNCGVPAIAMSVLELCISYYEALDDAESLRRIKALYYKATIEKREKDRIRMRSSLEFYESIINIKLQRNQATRENMRLQMENNTDALTGLPNRRMLNTVAENSFETAFLDQKLLGFEILDIDFFKQLNDNYGHRYGDDCLRNIAEILKRITAEDDRVFAARYGGDEFCIIYSNMTDIEIRDISLRIRAEVLDLKIPAKGSKVSEYMTVSQGIRNSIPRMRNRTWDFMFAADTALYRVKEFKKGEILIVHSYRDTHDEWSSVGNIPE